MDVGANRHSHSSIQLNSLTLPKRLPPLCMFLSGIRNSTRSASFLRSAFRTSHWCYEMSEPRDSSAAPVTSMPVTGPSTAAAVDPSAKIVAATAPATEESSPPKLSKKAMKKKRRYEKAIEIKRRRKEQDRDQKRARALAEGRDLDEERRIQKQNEESGEGRRRREEKWLAKIDSAKSRFRIAVDCGYEEEMTKKEINSLAQQLRYCYAANKRSKNPCYFSVASLSGVTREHLDNVCGFPEQWKLKAFDFSDKSLEDMHRDEKDKLVYLTSDSDNTLEHLDDSKIYVIGGIVDRNRLKYATLNQAKELGIETAKLPISQHLKLFSTNVLTTNHVFEILLKYRENNNNWKEALVDVLPKRKDMKEIDDEKANEKEEGGTPIEKTTPDTQQGDGSKESTTS